MRTTELFGLGLLAGPAVLLLHECAHFAAAAAAGASPVLQADRVLHDPLPGAWRPWVTVAGPAVEYGLGTIGFAWLRRTRRGREAEPVSRAEWLATGLALCWARALKTVPVGLFGRGDELRLSAGLGWPELALPLAITAVALLVLGAVVRLHPPEGRAAPLAALLSGAAAGAGLWVFAVGPRVLG